MKRQAHDEDTLASPEKVLRMADLTLMLGLSQAQLYRLIAKGDFPKPFLIVPNGRAKGWILSDVNDWLETRIMEGIR